MISIDLDFPPLPRESWLLHFLDFETRDVHAANDIGKEGDHVVVAHGHVGNDLFQGDFLDRVVLVLLAAAVELEAQLSYLALLSNA